jgi:hypothetical protein
MPYIIIYKLQAFKYLYTTFTYNTSTYKSTDDVQGLKNYSDTNVYQV